MKTLSAPHRNREIKSLHLGLHHFNPPYKGKLTKTKESLGKSNNDYSKDKGMQIQVCKNGVQFYYSFFALTSSPPL